MALDFSQDITLNTIVANCNLLAKVMPSGANPVAGQVKASVFFDPFSTTFPYVARHYEVSPLPYVANNTLTGTITLYFTQAEFGAYNSNVQASATTLLPLNITDVEN